MAPPTKMLRMSLKLQIKESNRKDIIDILILNEKNKVCLPDVKIWRHDVIYRHTAKIWRHKIKSSINNEPSFVKGRLTPYFFRYELEIRFE